MRPSDWRRRAWRRGRAPPQRRRRGAAPVPGSGRRARTVACWTSAPRPGDDEVLLLEAGVAVVAVVPLVAEAVQGVVELRLAAVGHRVLARDDRGAVDGPEVLAVVARPLEGGHL